MGAILWSSIGVSLGYILGKSAESIFGKIEKLEHFILIVLVIILLTWLIKKYLLSKYLHKKDDKG
jgi:membrane protein DedA with SNARE-associated domain